MNMDASGARAMTGQKAEKERKMSDYIKIGIFIITEILIVRVVNLVFRFMSRKHNSVHLRFTKR